MKVLIGTTIMALAITVYSASLQCKSPSVDEHVQSRWLDIDLKNECLNIVRQQIQKEIEASMTYLAMGAFFSKKTLPRPGLAKFFFRTASEERHHATRLMEYLLMRGKLTEEFKTSESENPLSYKRIINLISIKTPNKTAWSNGIDALRDAQHAEGTVRVTIKKVIARCKNNSLPDNNYRLANYMNIVYLKEQNFTERDLAGKITTLDSLTAMHGPLGESLFDKKLEHLS